MNYFHALTRRAEDTTGNWAHHHAPTLANPHIAPEEIEEARRSLPERVFAQEYLAQFLEDGGGVFRRVTAAVDTSLAPETWLVLCGLAALVTGVALDRYLRQPRNGLTSAALTDRDDPLDLLQTAGAALLAQRTAQDFSSPEPTFTPGGGRFGGGGASGSY
jgi:hypothetical protein